MRTYIQDQHDRILRFLRKQPFLKEIRHQIIKLLPLVLGIEMKYVPKNTIIVEQGDRCKRVYWNFHGKLSVLRKVGFIDALNKPLRE